MIRVFTVLSLIIASMPTSAEWCHMVGCAGAFGYIYVPRSQIRTAPISANQKMWDTISPVNSTKRYPIDDRKRLFVEKGLPPVNSIVTLNVNAAVSPILFTDNQEIIDELKQSPYIFKDEVATIRVYTMPGPNRLRQGSRLLILGYQGTGEKFGDELSVIAFVRIIDDGGG
jgi:hypothetical protein